MKKNIILLLIFAGLFASSCDIQLDDAFDQNAAARVDEQVEELFKVLTSAPNGWVMEYYPEKSQSYGGVNILVSFNTDYTVLMTNENITNLSATERSSFTINRSSGAVLSFDTYNQYISYYADPSVTLGEGKRYGFMGDLAFAAKSISDKEIVLQGTKTMNKIVMKPVPSDITWEQYIANVQKVKKDVKGEYITMFEATVGENTQGMTINPTYTLLSYTYEDEGGVNRTVVSSYMYTEDGIKFYEPLEIFGEKLQNFAWDDQQLSFICTDPGMTGRLQGKRTPYFRPYDFYLGTWKFYSASTSGANPVMTVTITEDVYEKTLKISGITFTSSYGTIDIPIIAQWYTNGRIEIFGNEKYKNSVGNFTFTYAGRTFENHPVYLYGYSSTGIYYTVGLGMISKTDLIENRIDLVNNGVNPSVIGLGFCTHPLNASDTEVNLTLGRFHETMYMVKE